MKGSIIRQMGIGFSLIITMFIITVVIMFRGMGHIHSQFNAVTDDVFPLLDLSNQTSVKLLSADKAFKDFLTSQDEERMDQMRASFIDSKSIFSETFEHLYSSTRNQPNITETMETLRKLQALYFTEAEQAMENYREMVSAYVQVQNATRRFQKLSTELRIGINDYIDKQDDIAVKLMAKSYFLKLKKAEETTSDALSSEDLHFVRAAINRNKKSISHLNYAYKGLVAQLPSLKDKFDKPIEKFTKDIGKANGVLDKYYIYLSSKHSLYTNISNLADKADEMIQNLESITTIVTDDLSTSLSKADKIKKESLKQALLISAMTIVIAISAGYYIARSVYKPLDNIIKGLAELSNGNMTVRIRSNYKNEFSRVGEHINLLTENLWHILSKINTASDTFEQFAMNNQNTSHEVQERLDKQNKQIASAASAMTEMESSVNEVAQSATYSLEKIRRVETASDSGYNIMHANIATVTRLESRLNKSVAAVSDLQEMSSKIDSILDVIQNIAEQTNLLALNAAIEAARAGEQGRGFAVVADEVRVLAQRTSDSTTEIENMIVGLRASSENVGQVITSCMHDMSESITQASEANKAMKDIQAQVTEISHLSTHISQATVEQRQAASEIACSLEDVSHIADSSYQAMLDIIGISDDLTHLAGDQRQLIAQFRF